MEGQGHRGAASLSGVPPKMKSAGLGWFGVGLLGFVAVGLAAVVYCFNPATSGIYPVCQFHQWTGLNCPGCGATRGLYALLHGQVRVALRDNALLVAGLVFILGRGGWWLTRGAAAGSKVFFPGSWCWALLVVVLVFGVLRNLPGFDFLSPA